MLFDRDDGVVTLCEIKYTNSAFVIDKEYAQKLIQKRDVFQKRTGTEKTIFIDFISANGLKPTMYSEELIANFMTLDELFEN